MNASSIDHERERTVYHGIGRAKNNDRTEILEAQYGDSWHTSGTVNMPPADFLYVKWRDKTTDQVYEDRVDLTKRLPSDEEMHGQKVYFLVEDNQLYVYLIPRTEWGTKLNHRPRGQRPNGPFGYHYLDVKTLYPDNAPPVCVTCLSVSVSSWRKKHAKKGGRSNEHGGHQSTGRGWAREFRQYKPSRGKVLTCCILLNILN